MYNKKRYLKYLFSFVIVIMTVGVNSFVQAETAERGIDGVIYEGEIRTIESMEDLTTNLNIKEMDIKDGKLSFNADVTYEGTQFTINSSGIVYNTMTDFISQSTNAKTVIFDTPDEYEIISFTIEEKADKNLLLPINKSLTGKVVMKMTVKINGGKQTLYYEGEAPNIFDEMDSITIDLETQLNQVEQIKDSKIKNKTIADIETKMDKVTRNEKWFLEYVKENKTQKVSEEDEIGKDLMGLRPGESPVPGIQWDEFQKVRKVISTASNNVGYYKNTIEWPYGTGNKLTDILKWSWVGNSPNDIDITAGGKSLPANVTLKVVNAEQYYWIDETREIIFYDDFVPVRLANPEIAVATGTNSGIFMELFTTGYRNNGDLEIDLLSLTGVLPMSKWISNLKTILSSITLRPASGTGGFYSYHDTIQGNIEELGEALRYFSAYSEEPLSKVGDYDNIRYKIVIPMDQEGSRTGYKNVKFSYDFDIEVQDFYGIWNLEEDVFKEKSAGFRAHE